MIEKSKPNQNKYTYKYVQFTVTSSEKKQIKHFANKENFKMKIMLFISPSDWIAEELTLKEKP